MSTKTKGTKEKKTKPKNSEKKSETIKVEESVSLEIHEQKLAEEKDKFIRLFAEFENFKKRSAKERIELYKTANSEVLVSLLPVVDDFNRSMNDLEKSGKMGDLEGVHLIYTKLFDILEKQGLKEIEIEQGAQFDVDFHEAITQIPAPDEKLKGKVVDVIEKGYELNGKVIRFAKVVVGQ